MPVLSLSIGSNVDAEANVRRACALLREHFGELQVSTVYESESVGFSGDNFLNLVVTAQTDEALADINQYLKHLEDGMGRDRSRPRFSERIIDVDILFYGDSAGVEAGMELPRKEITHNAYVLCPLAELEPETVHPPTGKTYARLWQEYDKSRQPLLARDFDWSL